MICIIQLNIQYFTHTIGFFRISRNWKPCILLQSYISNFVQPHYANIIDIFDILHMLSKHYFPTENIICNDYFTLIEAKLFKFLKMVRCIFDWGEWSQENRGRKIHETRLDKNSLLIGFPFIFHESKCHLGF